MKAILITTLLLCSIASAAQVGIINDADGYTNVRGEPNGQAEIVHRINDNELFWFGDLHAERNEWIEVSIPQNKFSFGSTDWSHVDGFIHRSRIRPLDKLPPYNGIDFQFQYVLQPFDSSGRIIDRKDGFVLAIDGRRVWGRDGDLPKTEVKEIRVSINGKRVEIHPVFYRDLFECDSEFNVYKNGETYFVEQWNSDGAGAYLVVWVFAEGKLTQRFVGML